MQLYVPKFAKIDMLVSHVTDMSLKLFQLANIVNMSLIIRRFNYDKCNDESEYQSNGRLNRSDIAITNLNKIKQKVHYLLMQNITRCQSSQTKWDRPFAGPPTRAKIAGYDPIILFWPCSCSGTDDRSSIDHEPNTPNICLNGDQGKIL